MKKPREFYICGANYFHHHSAALNMSDALNGREVIHVREIESDVSEDMPVEAWPQSYEHTDETVMRDWNKYGGWLLYIFMGLVVIWLLMVGVEMAALQGVTQ